MKHGFNAFTLAEVLITLAIIGVVAALTIPQLVQNYQERVTVTKVKKAYSLLSNSLQLAILENGTVDRWGLTNSDSLNNDGEVVVDYTSAGKVFDRLSKYWQGTILEPDWDQNLVICNMQGVSLAVADGVINYAPVEKNVHTAMRLNDGSILNIGGVYQPCLNDGVICSGAVLYIPDKSQKFVQGKSEFYFYIGKDRIRPAGYKGDFVNGFEQECNISINNRQSGRGCVAWIIENGNMDYLKCDDLEWGNKTKCN